ncbi:Uncharacterized protein FKW44_024012, partial [Caligus rogercresseyi]
RQSLITLFTMMLPTGITELQSINDIGYLRQTLAVEKSEEDALDTFRPCSQMLRGSLDNETRLVLPQRTTWSLNKKTTEEEESSPNMF